MGLAIESREISISKADPLEVAETLRKAAASDWDKAFGLSDKQDILHRLALLREHYPEEIPSEAALQEALSNSIWGKSSFKELRSMSFPQIVQQALSYRARSLLDSEAPTHVQVPSGRKHALDYTQNPPVLAVRIQELFGMQDAPRIAGGKVKVMLHLLAPNYRPQQVTNDLSSFWKNTYPEIRKELRARYPKHAWPENP
jgi:ATP-dependent helicase HrpB